MSDRPIPRSWNDRHLWLLEHLLGLPQGSNGLAIALGSPTSHVLLRVRVPVAAAGPATELPVQMPDGVRAWEVTAFAFVRTSGTASSFRPRLGEVASFVADGIDERITYDAQPVATPIRDVYCAPIPVRADSLFRLYLRPGFDAGTDNDGTAEVWLRQSFESEGSS